MSVCKAHEVASRDADRAAHAARCHRSAETIVLQDGCAIPLCGYHQAEPWRLVVRDGFLYAIDDGVAPAEACR
jgi:hypothetical protein